MMAAVARARHGILAPYLQESHVGIGSINSPMQCMMKEICAQCLQPQVDPVTGKTTYVFSCFNQDQPLDAVDLPSLRDAAEAEFAAGKAHRPVDRPRARDRGRKTEGTVTP